MGVCEPGHGDKKKTPMRQKLSKGTCKANSSVAKARGQRDGDRLG